MAHSLTSSSPLPMARGKSVVREEMEKLLEQASRLPRFSCGFGCPGLGLSGMDRYPSAMKTIRFIRMMRCHLALALSAAVSVAGETGFPQAVLMGKRFLMLNTSVRVRQIEVTRDSAHGPDESSVHTPAEARAFREAIEKAWPGARITWAFSWLALHDERENYRDLRDLVVFYQKKSGDEITFIPEAYFANRYNTREQVNRDLHEGLAKVSEITGNGYRPKSVVAGFLSADNLRYHAEVEGIHVCQGNIWSQYVVDNGDGEGSICYPYYPLREHFCKPAHGKDDFIDIVNLEARAHRRQVHRKGFPGCAGDRLPA